MSASAAIDHKRWAIVIGLVLGFVLAVSGRHLADAAHESTNTLTFAPANGAPAGASGAGLIEYQGGEDEASRWTTTFSFTGLQPDTRYVVMVQGRFGEDASPSARAFTPLCSFVTSATGDGVCWHYIRQLRRLSIVELRQGNASGSTVLAATRGEGAGTIGSTPNASSPPPSSPVPATPPDPGTPAASPTGG